MSCVDCSNFLGVGLAEEPPVRAQEYEHLLIHLSVLYIVFQFCIFITIKRANYGHVFIKFLEILDFLL
jgi:hypothetical protein